MQLKRFKTPDIKFIHILAVMLLLHVAVSLKTIQNPIVLLPTSTDEPIKIKLVSEQKNQSNKTKQIVDTEKSNLKTPAIPQFLGKENNSVDRQTRSKTVASFKKAGFGNSKEDSKEQKQSSSAKNEAKTKGKKLSFNDLAMGMHRDVKPTPSMRKGIKTGDKAVRGLGQSNDFVRDIPLGDFTKLNTQEYEFYGFYHRIKEKLEQFWGRNIQEQAEKMYKNGRTIASDSNHLTSLIITLNQRGEIVKVNINATSGIKELDQAAIKSFNEAGPFPNPPKKMLKNGVAQIEWGFVVNT